MKNFGLMVKMMVMVLAMGALFCSCNAAGGSDYYEAPASKITNADANGSDGPSRPVSFSIVIPEINVSVSGADVAKQSATETATITASATEGAQFMWYVNGMLQEGENGSTFELSLAHPGIYDVTCIAYSADGTLAKSASKVVTVNPR